MSTVTQGDFLNACDTLIAAATANADKPGVTELRVQLEANTDGVKEAQARRALHKALAQQASRDLDLYLATARQLYSRLRHVLIGLFGLRAEKLAEFGLQPLRPAQKPTTNPPETSANPSQAAASETDGTI